MEKMDCMEDKIDLIDLDTIPHNESPEDSTSAVSSPALSTKLQNENNPLVVMVGSCQKNEGTTEPMETVTVKEVSDRATLTPSHWTSEAAQRELNLLRKRDTDMKFELKKCYEIEAASKDYISVLKCRSRNVDTLMDRVREVEDENRHLKRDLEFGFDDSVVQRKRIEFLERKVDILVDERECLLSECSDLRKKREEYEKDVIAHQRRVSAAYKIKLEEELKKVELQLKNQNEEDRLCSSCLCFKTAGSRSAVGPGGMNSILSDANLESRVILVNPRHPSYDKIRSASIAELRRQSSTESQSTTVRMDDRTEFSYYAAPMKPVRRREFASHASVKREAEVRHRQVTQKRTRRN